MDDGLLLVLRLLGFRVVFAVDLVPRLLLGTQGLAAGVPSPHLVLLGEVPFEHLLAFCSKATSLLSAI